MDPGSVDDSYIGKLIAGRYAIVQKLNQGGMGAVYLAVQRPLDRPVALKVLLRQHADDPISAKRFEKEARAVSRLTHPHIVTLYDFGRTEAGELYIAMEYLQGTSLRDVIDSSSVIAWDRSLHIIRGITSALVAAHNAGIIHRDLKPENVMLVERSGDVDFPKVLDFGLARSIDGDQGNKPITQHDVIPGTPAYMSPERANGVSDDPRSDLYALGAMWFELLVGRPPFEGESSIKIILRHIHDAPPLPSRAQPHNPIPKHIDEMILNLLEKHPDRRPRSAADLLQRIDELIRPRGWHASTGGAVAAHTAQDEALRAFANEAAALDELDFKVESVHEEPLLLTRRKTALPPANESIVLSMGAMPPPEEPVLLAASSKKPTPVALPSAPPALDTSDAALHLLKQVKPTKRPQIVQTPTPARLTIHSIAEVASHMAQAKTAREVAELAVAFLATRFDRTFVVDMRGGTPQVLASLQIPDVGGIPGAVIRCQSLREMLLRKDAYYGPAIASPDWLGFFRTLSGSLPGAVFVGALKRDGAAAFFFYGDHRDMGLRPDVKDTVTLMREAAGAFSSVSM